MRTSALTGHWEPQRTLSFMRVDVMWAGQDALPWMPGRDKGTNLLL